MSRVLPEGVETFPTLPPSDIRFFALASSFGHTRLAAGDREQAQDSLWLAMQGDPILRRAVERAGVQKLTAGALAHYKELVETGGAHVAAHPSSN